MPREKVINFIDREFHFYTESEVTLLKRFREAAIEILVILSELGIKGFVHGSVARGDISNTSDIDIYIPNKVSSFYFDILDEFDFSERHIIMGTPNSTIHGVISRSDNISVSFPLSMPREREIEFYRFSGLVYLENLLEDIRVSGVTKQLLLIEPDNNGYWFSSLKSNIKRAMNLLSLSQRIIDERIRVLTRRDKLGRTGLLLDYLLSPEENFEQALKSLADRNALVRKMLKKKKK